MITGWEDLNEQARIDAERAYLESKGYTPQEAENILVDISLLVYGSAFVIFVLFALVGCALLIFGVIH